MPQLTYATPENVYAGKDVEGIRVLNKTASDQYDTSLNTKTLLDNVYNNLNIRAEGKHIKNKAFNEYKKRIDDAVSGGNYQDIQYHLNDMINSFKNNKELQGAIQDTQKYQTAIQDLKDRLESGSQNISSSETEGTKDNKEITKRKGGINKEQYLFGMNKLQQLNSGKLSYNPNTGLMDNGFQNYNIVDDKSKEVYDAVDKLTNDWKGKDIKFGDKTFKVNPNVSGGYIDFESGQEVKKTDIQEAAKEYLKQRGDFKDYFDQQNDIELHKATGGTNQVDLGTLSRLGVGKSDLESLQKSGATNEDLKTLAKRVLSEKQLDNFTDPFAEKNSFSKTTHDFKLNELLLEDIKHKNILREKKLEQPIFDPSNSSVTLAIGQNEVDKLNKTAIATKERMNQIAQQYGNNMPPDIANEFSSLKGDLEVYNNQHKDLYNSMAHKGFDVYKTAENSLFDESKLTGAGRFLQYKDLYKFLTSNPLTSNLSIVKDLQPFANISNANAELGTGIQQLPDLHSRELAAQAFVKQIKNNPLFNTPQFKKAVMDYTDNVLQNPTENDFKGGTEREVSKVKDKYFENNEKIQYNINTSVMTPTGDKDSPIDQFNKIVDNQVKNGTDFKTSDDKSIADLISEYNEKQGDKGKKIDISDVKVAPTTKRILNKFATQVTFPNGTSQLMYPNDQNTYARNLTTYARGLSASEIPDNRAHGNEILGQVNFGGLRNIYSKLMTEEIGSIVPIDLPTQITKNGDVISTDPNARNKKYGIKVVNKYSDGSPIFALTDAKGNETPFDLTFSKIGGENKFGSIDDLINSIQALNVRK